MISKVLLSDKGYATSKYVMEDKSRATVIASQGVRDYDFRMVAEDMNTNKGQLPGFNRHVVHCILSFPHHEQPNFEEMEKYGKQYLQKLNLHNSPYILVHHNDTPHSHFHIISSLVDLQGNKVSDSWIGLRGKKAAQAITKKYGLTPADKKNIGKMNLVALNEKDAVKFDVYNIVNSALLKSNSFDQFEESLNHQGVTMKFKYKRGADQVVQGISFSYSGYSYKGSEVDRNLSYLKVAAKLAENTNKLNVNEKTPAKEDSKLEFENTSSLSDKINLSDLNLGGHLNSNSTNDYEENEQFKRKKRRNRKKIK